MTNDDGMAFKYIPGSMLDAEIIRRGLAKDPGNIEFVPEKYITKDIVIG